MLFRGLADLVVVLHLLFVAFVVLGGLLVLRRPRLAWLHLPALAWGIFVECAGWTCPLTPLEQSLRTLAGEAGYTGGFIEHYLLPLLYPPGLARPEQWLLAGLALGINLAIYGFVFRWMRQRVGSG